MYLALHPKARAEAAADAGISAASAVAAMAAEVSEEDKICPSAIFLQAFKL